MTQPNIIQYFEELDGRVPFKVRSNSSQSVLFPLSLNVKQFYLIYR